MVLLEPILFVLALGCGEGFWVRSYASTVPTFGYYRLLKAGASPVRGRESHSRSLASLGPCRPQADESARALVGDRGSPGAGRCRLRCIGRTRVNVKRDGGWGKKEVLASFVSL